jgi:hypothetical protein
MKVGSTSYVAGSCERPWLLYMYDHTAFPY